MEVHIFRLGISCIFSTIQIFLNIGRICFHIIVRPSCINRRSPSATGCSKRYQAGILCPTTAPRAALRYASTISHILCLCPAGVLCLRGGRGAGLARLLSRLLRFGFRLCVQVGHILFLFRFAGFSRLLLNRRLGSCLAAVLPCLGSGRRLAAAVLFQLAGFRLLRLRLGICVQVGHILLHSQIGSIRLAALLRNTAGTRAGLAAVLGRIGTSCQGSEQALRSVPPQIFASYSFLL